VLVPALVLLPIAATRLMFWGMGGAVHPSTFPADWYRAESIVAARPGMVLALPWSEYEPIGFADNRTIVNPAAYFFSAPTLVSQNPQLLVPHSTPQADSRDRYVSNLMDRPSRIARFGHLLAPLGVRYIALEHVAAYRGYVFLQRQSDLRLLLRGPMF